MDIAVWLHGLGLQQYEQTFRENAIDDAVLPELTADDLKDLGVSLVGHRRKLLAAIAALRRESGPGSRAEVRHVADTSIAERRHLSIMFCDLVGSTMLSTRYDPEDLREIVGAYHHCVADTVARFAGFVAKYMGDGVLIYFGYPEAHEDDAERAVHAGLAVIEAVGRIAAPERLNVRLGIASGLVVVGDLIGIGEAQERGVVGETPNLAARLQMLAQAGTLVIAEGTRRQIGALFDIEDLGPQRLAGFAAPQRAWRVVGESDVLSRFEALRAAAPTPLVGREEEIELLQRRWRTAASGEGQVVLICGEPGIGKSRLSAALRERLEGEEFTRLRYFCSPHHQDSALYPFIAQLQRAAGFEREDPLERKLDKLESLLAPASPPAEEVGLLAELLALPAASRYPLQPSTPQRTKGKNLAALLRQLEALARQKPVLMVFEDLHWIDPSSRELLDLTIERIATLPVLLVATFRPEFVPPWTGPQVAAITLARLDRRTGAAMVEGIAGNRALSSEVAAEIVERADGVPLFVEELTKAVLEVGEAETTLASTVSPSVAVPAALHAPLMARLDRLGQVIKEIAQIAAAIGREFSYELLAPVAQRREEELQDALDRLGDAGLVFHHGSPPYATYLFKHALVRDAAYGSLLRRRREALHARIAAVLEADFPETVAAQPEIVAHHYTEAGLAEQAVPYWHRAGEHAVARSANLEAIAYLNRGIEVLQKLSDSAERDERELEFQAGLLTPLWASRGFGSPQAESAATRALELCRRIGADTPAHFRALYGLWFVYHVRAELRIARELAEQYFDLAERLQDPERLGYAHFGMGNTLFWFGELAAARASLQQGLALYDPERGRSSASRYGFNCASNCHLFLGRVLWHLGYPDQALRSSEQAIAIAEAVSHPFSQALALSWAAALHQLRREVGKAREQADADLALCDEQVIPFFGAHAMVLRGWALVEQGEEENGFAELRRGLAAYRATGAELERPHWLGLMAEACGKTGRIEEGLRVISEALSEIDQNGVRYYEAELHRLEGELIIASRQPDEGGAEVSFRKAIEVARAEQAKSWELRAATSLARLFKRQGRQAEARDIVAPVFAWFTEGFDTADLKEAKALLDELMA